MDQGSSATDSAIEIGMEDLNIAEPDHVKLAANMASRCSLILMELEEFQSHLREKKREHVVDIRAFKNDIEGELKRIKNLPMDNPKRCTQYLSCTNLPFLEALWSTAKRTTGIKTLLPTGFRSMSEKHKLVAKANIVARNGSEWIKVSTITERQMIFDLAKSGWVEGDSSDDDDGDDNFSSEGLLKVAEDLIKVAKSVRVRYRKPVVRMVLPRIYIRECHKAVAKILQKIAALGVILETAEDMPDTPIPISQARDRMAPDPFEGLSDTLNIDTTILLAFASDISHDSVEPKDWYHHMIASQIRMERDDQLLPSFLWPACGARKLVCTREAADKALEIVEIIGTQTERQRMALLLNVDVSLNELSHEQRIHEFQKLSKYQVPTHWSLPIEVVEVDLDKIKSKLPPVASKVAEILRSVNPSVFFFGWGSGYTTITSNGTVAREIEKTIEENRIAEESGPNVLIAPASRSLVGKEKERRGAILDYAE